ncbi:hypothetical protein BHM03_00015490, partial [Ensete ventricosum]
VLRSLEMGTREVYEEKLRRGNLHHDPTINPGLGSARCPRCLSLINPNSEKEEWTINSVLNDATSVAGSGVGVMLSAVHGMNRGIPFIQKHVKGPKWLHFLIVWKRGGDAKAEQWGAGEDTLMQWGLGEAETAQERKKDYIGYEYRVVVSLLGTTWYQTAYHLMPPLLLYSGASASLGGKEHNMPIVSYVQYPKEIILL